MGRVVAAQDRDLKRHVAMKILKTDGNSGHLTTRFIEEAQLTGQLEHPNVLPVYDFGVNDDGELYFTMRYVRNHESLAHIISELRKGNPAMHLRFSIERRVQVIQQVCHALHYAHQRGVIHRDIKPANILLGTNGEVFLADWGVAKLARRQEEARSTDVTTSRVDEGTRDGAVIGSPAYMSPEQLEARQDAIDARSDVFALSAVLYELLTLKHHLGDIPREFPELVRRVREGKHVLAEDLFDRLNGRTPKPLSRICRQGLAVEPADRFQTALDVERALQAWIEKTNPVVCTGTRLQRIFCTSVKLIDRRPLLMPAVFVTIGVLVPALAIFGLWKLFSL